MEHHGEIGWVKKYFFSADHKMIGMQYMIVGVIMAFLGGYLAYNFRTQLAYPDLGILSGAQYNTNVTMHGLIMVLWVAMPILVAAFGNLLVPTMLGCDDMAYPTLNMLSFWIFLLSAVLAVLSLLVGGYGGGWTLYPPLSAGMPSNVGGGYGGVLPGLFSGGSIVLIAVALEFIAFLMGGLNFLVTTINMRAPGMKFFDIPFVVWMINISVLLFMFSVGPLMAGSVMLLFDRVVGSGFFDPAKGGDPLTFQHLFWFFGHPEVYVVLLPSLGFTGEVISTFTRKPLFAYKKIIVAIIIAGVLSFFIWAHHQFVAGINPKVAFFFTVGTLLISVPFGTVIFCLIITLYKASIQFTVPMLWALGFLVTFIIGGITGIYLGSLAIDISFHDTYFVVAHFHYTFIPITIFGGMAGVYYWYPKFFGRFYNDFLGKLHFWLTFIFFNSAFLPMFLPGAVGQHRRVAGFTLDTYPDIAEYQGLKLFILIMVIGMILTQFIWLGNMIWSAIKGKKAEKNPWKANTLEWTAESPPPHGNFAQYPTVYRGPYEYSVPGRKTDYWPQDQED